jgi:hypothetical protein
MKPEFSTGVCAASGVYSIVASLTLSDAAMILGIAVNVVSVGYTLWKWWKEWRKG